MRKKTTLGERITRTFRRRIVVAALLPAGALAFYWFPVMASGQAGQSGAADREEGIPISDPVVIAKCGSCHARDSHGNMERLSWARTTPEGWQDALKQMVLLHNLSVTPAEARSIVKYLSDSHGLAPEEAEPVRDDSERRVHEESSTLSDSLRDICAKCHSFARVLSWHRSAADWKQFADTHAARYQIGSTAEAVAFLSKAASLRTPAWDAWQSRSAQNLAGKWLVTAFMPGHGTYCGEMQIDRDRDYEYRTRVSLSSIKDGSRVVRSGRMIVYGGSAWRGRSTGSGTAAASPDDIASEAREVLLITPNGSAASGRWFWGQYQEFAFDVTLQRASADPALLAVDRSSLRAGTRGNRARLIGNKFPAQIAPGDLDFGSGVGVRRIVSNSPVEIVAELDVAVNAPLGRRGLRLHQSILPAAMAIYDRVDYIKVSPDSTVAAFGDSSHPKGYRQFEAIGYQRGPDGKAHTADDVALGPVDVAWTVQVFHSAEGITSNSVGTINPVGLFTPADLNPNLNFDIWAIATARDEKDRNGAPLVGKSYMVVTVPTYTFNGRRYVRDLDRWVDDGPDR